MYGDILDEVAAAGYKGFLMDSADKEVVARSVGSSASQSDVDAR